MFLDTDTFSQIVKFTPLISIDLVIVNQAGKVLLGQRNNRPARGFWFVPGGRILKDETLSVAFNRLTVAEIGLSKTLHEAEFLGVYEHFYEDNFSNENFTTHYVVLGYKLKIEFDLNQLPLKQHNQYCLLYESELLQNKDVHQNTKAYFINP